MQARDTQCGHWLSLSKMAAAVCSIRCTLESAERPEGARGEGQTALSALIQDNPSQVALWGWGVQGASGVLEMLTFVLCSDGSCSHLCKASLASGVCVCADVLSLGAAFS